MQIESHRLAHFLTLIVKNTRGILENAENERQAILLIFGRYMESWGFN